RGAQDPRHRVHRGLGLGVLVQPLTVLAHCLLRHDERRLDTREHEAEHEDDDHQLDQRVAAVAVPAPAAVPPGLLEERTHPAHVVVTVTAIGELVGSSTGVLGHDPDGDLPDTLRVHAPAGNEVFRAPVVSVTPRVSGFSVVAHPEVFSGVAVTVALVTGTPAALRPVMALPVSWTVGLLGVPGPLTAAGDLVPPDAAGSACAHWPAHIV